MSPYDNAGATISGTVDPTQGAYQFEFDDWSGDIDDNKCKYWSCNFYKW